MLFRKLKPIPLEVMQSAKRNGSVLYYSAAKNANSLLNGVNICPYDLNLSSSVSDEKSADETSYSENNQQ
uniref:Uncharacterized protein n=1 Tax=Ditylenchus dipsaci TaxID=166011 RepID=A0A915D380_9BILA